MATIGSATEAQRRRRIAQELIRDAQPKSSRLSFGLRIALSIEKLSVEWSLDLLTTWQVKAAGALLGFGAPLIGIRANNCQARIS